MYEDTNYGFRWVHVRSNHLYSKVPHIDDTLPGDTADVIFVLGLRFKERN
jgi:hypothetical protein